MTETKYTRRSDDDRIKELEAKILGIRTRGERRQARANPAVRLTAGAVKLLDKALNATQDAVARKVIEEARQGLGAYVSTHGWAVPTAGAASQAPVKRGRKQRVA